MNPTPLADKLPDGERPTDPVQPEREQAVRGLKALNDGRLRDAETNIEEIPDSLPIDRVWKKLLGGRYAAARGDLSAAEPLLSEAASLAPVAGLEGKLEPDAASLRLAAQALQHLGLVYRRRDLPDKAYRSHLSAYHIRNEHGSFEELWESTLSLGIDADLAGRYDDGQTWHRIAIDAAVKASTESQRKQAVAWTYLSASLTQSRRHDEAVTAARTARQWWQRYDIGAVTAARADMKLGNALLKLGESLHDSDPDQAPPVLEEAIEWLTSASEALEAFGPDNAHDVRWCAEQIDFARRLRRSLDS